MKKILTVTIIGLVCFSIFSALTPRVKTETTVAYLTDYVQLTTNPYSDKEPLWSRDSLKITWFAASSNEFRDRHIWKMNADGSGKTQLTFGAVVDEGGDWSPDQAHIVFSRYGLRGLDAFDLMMMNSDGSDVTQITSSGYSHQEPHWSNDGTKIAFSYGTFTYGLIYEVHVINPDGTNELTLIENAYHAQWSPDDRQLAVDRDDGIWLVSAFPPYETRRIYAVNEPMTYPQFSPDGKHIVFRMSGDLHLIDVNGSYIGQLTNDGTVEYPHDWSPDGQWIAFTSSRSGNPDVWKARIVLPPIPATVDIDPDTLNLGSKGQFITCYIELLRGYDVANINISTIMLNNTVAAELTPTAFGDYDNDTVPDLMVKFNRTAVSQTMLSKGIVSGKVVLTITGNLNDGTPFQGNDTIRIIFPPNSNAHGKKFPI